MSNPAQSNRTHLVVMQGGGIGPRSPPIMVTPDVAISIREITRESSTQSAEAALRIAMRR